MFIQNCTGQYNLIISQTVRTTALLAGLVLLSGNSLAGEKVDESLQVDANSLIEIEHVRGKAKIIGWDKSEVKIEGELGEDSEGIKFERDGKSVIIEVDSLRSSWSWSENTGPGDKLIIHVPYKSRVDYDSPNADLDIENIYGGVNIEMINGDLSANTLQGRLNLRTVNGDIRAEKLSGELLIDAVNGDISASQINGDRITVTTVNGDIDIDSSASEIISETVNGDIDMRFDKVIDLQTNTVNGDISMRLSLMEGASVKASSVGGTIEFAFQKDVQARFNIEAHAGGSIKNRITDQQAKSAKYGPSKWLRFSNGQPTATVDVSTVHGKIELNKQ